MTNGILDSSQKIVTNGLVLNYDVAQLRSYPTTGTTVTDLSGNSNNGTLVNGVAFNSDNGGSLVFDGVNDYVNTSIINLGKNGTVCLWIYKLGNGTPDAGNVVDLFANISIDGKLGWSCGLNVSTNKLDFYIANNGGYGVENFSTSIINLNTWYNVCFTYNGSIKVIYINGVQDSSFSSTVDGINTVNNWGIASRLTNLRCFNGRIPLSQLYNRALSATEVLQNYNANKSRFGL